MIEWLPGDRDIRRILRVRFLLVFAIMQCRREKGACFNSVDQSPFIGKRSDMTASET